jgi:hypothetical protein
MLEDDVSQLQALFEAEGEGLPRGDIQALCSPLVAVLVTMQLDTGILIANYKQACLFSCMHKSPLFTPPVQGFVSMVGTA